MDPIIAGEADRPLTASDIEAAIQAALADGGQKPAAVIVEVPHREIGGIVTPFDDLVRIRELTREHGIALHVDGARLLDAAPFFASTKGGEHSIDEIAALFDSVYVSFYKGVGGITGAMLFGSSSDFLDEARTWLRRCAGRRSCGELSWRQPTYCTSPIGLTIG